MKNKKKRLEHEFFKRENTRKAVDYQKHGFSRSEELYVEANEKEFGKSSEAPNFWITALQLYGQGRAIGEEGTLAVIR